MQWFVNDWISFEVFGSVLFLFYFNIEYTAQGVAFCDSQGLVLIYSGKNWMFSLKVNLEYVGACERLTGFCVYSKYIVIKDLVCFWARCYLFSSCSLFLFVLCWWKYISFSFLLFESGGFMVIQKMLCFFFKTWYKIS